MVRNTLLATGVSILVLVAGCERSPAPEAPAQAANDSDAQDEGASETQIAAESDGRIRITLNGDGSIYSIEGRISPPEENAPVGDWQGPLKETEVDPESAGEIVATIEVRNFIANPSDESHSHGGDQDITGIPHCHKWIYIGTQRKLVHC